MLLGRVQPELGSSPEVLNFTRTVAVKYYYSIQTFLVPRRCSPSTGTHKFRASQPESKTPLGLFHTLHPPQGLPRGPFEPGQAAVPRRKAFKQLLFLEAHRLLPRGGPDRSVRWAPSSPVLLQRSVVLFMWRLSSVWKNIPVGLGFHMLDSSFFLLLPFFLSFPYVSLEMSPLFKVPSYFVLRSHPALSHGFPTAGCRGLNTC